MKLIGFLFDISGSMEQSYQKLADSISQRGTEQITRYHTLINLLERLVEEDNIKNEEFFSLAFGSQNKEEICDLVAVIKDYQKLMEMQNEMKEELKRQQEEQEELEREHKRKQEEFEQEEKIRIEEENKQRQQENEEIEEQNKKAQQEADKKRQQDEDDKNNIDCHKEVYLWVEKNGAKNISKYYKLEDFKQNFSKDDSLVLYRILQNRIHILQDFVKLLPNAVKEDSASQSVLVSFIDFFLPKDYGIVNGMIKILLNQLKSTINKNQDLVSHNDNQKKYIPEIQFLGFNSFKPQQFYSFIQKTSNEVFDLERKIEERLSIDENNIKTMKVKDLKQCFQNYGNLWNVSKSVLEKIAFGGTPLCRTLKITTNFLISQQNSQDKKKILFIISDGEAADSNKYGSLVNYGNKLKEADVLVCSCFMTDQANIESNQLYSEVQTSWNKGAQDMFQISSEVDNAQLTFIARNTNFKLSTKGKSRLFIQVNNSETLNQFFDLMLKIKDQNDALFDLIGKFDIEDYVNSNTEFEPKSYIGGGTSYANAISAVYCMASKRIYQRNGGHLDFFVVRDNLINKYGKNGVSTHEVLNQTCKEYRLRCENVNITQAKHILNSGRPLVASFSLCKQQWSEFFLFYRNTSKEILQSVGENSNQEIEEHTVVLISYGEDSLKFLSSFGTSFADRGFFKIKDEQVLGEMKFYDVFWKTEDLLIDEITKYQENGANIMNERLQRYKDIYDNIEYACPECQHKSQISQFEGSIYLATCPHCLKCFKPQKLGETFISYFYGKDI